MILFVQIVCKKKTDVLKTSVFFFVRKINYSLSAWEKWGTGRFFAKKLRKKPF